VVSTAGGQWVLRAIAQRRRRKMRVAKSPSRRPGSRLPVLLRFGVTPSSGVLFMDDAQPISEPRNSPRQRSLMGASLSFHNGRTALSEISPRAGRDFRFPRQSACRKRSSCSSRKRE
jgi:hypothetical protein